LGGQKEPSKISTQAKTIKITFFEARETEEETILIEEKTMENEMDRKPLQCACRSLNEGSKGMLPPPKSVPILRGPSKHTNKHKPKWYVKACLVCFHCKEERPRC
jgi:hypothetical protein